MNKHTDLSIIKLKVHCSNQIKIKEFLYLSLYRAQLNFLFNVSTELSQDIFVENCGMKAAAIF